ncbi:MAG: hypothetical protein NUW01_04020 [Gemmatimonadaceae bacterium]|nr:hypothetical protein [Gemmatimonadaceae bacterium]
MRVIARSAMLLALVLGGCADDDALVPDYTVLSAEGARHMSPSYSPDGKRIAWWAPGTDSLGEWQLWVASADLSAPVKLPVRGYNNLIAWSPDGTRIATMSTQFGVGSAVVVPVSGGEATRVTSNAGFDVPTAWYPDGDRLAYYASAGGGTITSFVVSIRTGVSAPAVAGEKRPYYAVPSPAGTHIAYQVVDGDRHTVWLADSAGRNARQLTMEGFESISPTSWSPDGRELLYVSRRTGTADIWVIPIDGKPARQLTRDVRNDFYGSWSSDGTWVAFVSERGRQTDVWVVPAAGGIERRITDTPAQEYTPARWRPGTHELTFVAEHAQSSVWAIDLANGTERRLTPDSIRVGAFFISPDGRQVVYTIVRGGGIHDLVVMPLAGGGSRVLLAGGGTVIQPRWSPDGSKIVFESDRGGTNDIWVIDASGGTPRQLVNWPGSEYSARWNADGSAVFFISGRDARVGDVWKVSPDGGEPTRVTRNGSVGNSIVTRAGVDDFFMGTIDPVGGQLGYSRVRPDGSLNAVGERANTFVSFISPSGDSLTGDVEQPDGKMRSMIISAAGGGGRIILKPGESVAWWSEDGSMLVYNISAGGARDLGIFRVADGTTRRLTTTPENEFGAEMTPDGKAVVFSRTKINQRIFTTDLSKLLAEGK